jgi:predicted PurR-regulated permease PerM
LFWSCLAAIVIASAIEPATHWCMKHKIRRLPAVVVIYVIIGLLLAAFFIFFVPTIFSEALTYINNLPDNINLNDLWSPLSNFNLFGAHDVSALPERTFSLRQLLNASRDLISGTGAGAFKTASLIFGGALGFILMIVLSFYLAVQEDGVGNFFENCESGQAPRLRHRSLERSQKKIGLLDAGAASSRPHCRHSRLSWSYDHRN